MSHRDDILRFIAVTHDKIKILRADGAGHRGVVGRRGANGGLGDNRKINFVSICILHDTAYM